MIRYQEREKTKTKTTENSPPYARWYRSEYRTCLCENCQNNSAAVHMEHKAHDNLSNNSRAERAPQYRSELGALQYSHVPEIQLLRWCTLLHGTLRVYSLHSHPPIPFFRSLDVSVLGNIQMRCSLMKPTLQPPPLFSFSGGGTILAHKRPDLLTYVPKIVTDRCSFGKV